MIGCPRKFDVHNKYYLQGLVLYEIWTSNTKIPTLWNKKGRFWEQESRDRGCGRHGPLGVNYRFYYKVWYRATHSRATAQWGHLVSALHVHQSSIPSVQSCLQLSGSINSIKIRVSASFLWNKRKIIVSFLPFKPSFFMGCFGTLFEMLPFLIPVGCNSWWDRWDNKIVAALY